MNLEQPYGKLLLPPQKLQKKKTCDGHKNETRTRRGRRPPWFLIKRMRRSNAGQLTESPA
uniref:Uncharacterized protein n=1 Tax=Arundo donax TaxID=35708 RepID=A0A0A9DJQ8_ARUDO